MTTRQEVRKMQRQKQMQESFLMAHREFITSLDKSLDMIAHDIGEAAEMSKICTDEWCLATEGVLDELAKVIYSISEPRWISKEDSKKISNQRHRIHDLYAQYKSVRR
jgi:hypothetical protein